MAQLKNSTDNDNHSILEDIARINEEHKIIDTRYYVAEITDAHETGGYYSQSIAEKREVVSPYYSTKGEAQEWLDKHEPDPGKRLKLVTQYKRRTVTERWW